MYFEEKKSQAHTTPHSQAHNQFGIQYLLYPMCCFSVRCQDRWSLFLHWVRLYGEEDSTLASRRRCLLGLDWIDPYCTVLRDRFSQRPSDWLEFLRTASILIYWSYLPERYDFLLVEDKTKLERLMVLIYFLFLLLLSAKRSFGLFVCLYGVAVGHIIILPYKQKGTKKQN